MRSPDPPALRDFWATLATASSAVLLLDYDGTLAPFHIDPAEARPYAGVEAALDRIGRLAGNRVVIISGRALDTLCPLLQLDVALEFWGGHGRERCLPDGRRSVTPVPEASQQGLAEAQGWTDMVMELGGRVERKPGSLAFHWRGLAPGQQRRLERDLERRFATLTQADALLWHVFDGGVELRAPDCDKGQAVRQVLDELDQGACVAYLGDDHTDEDAFRALDGRGLRLLVRPRWRATAADLWLRPPEGLLSFLDRWAEIRAGVQ